MAYQGSAAFEEEAQSQGVAAPSGLRQQQQIQAAEGGGQSQYEQQLAEQGYLPDAGPWYTGQNVEGTNNGWSTPFTRAFIEGQNRAAEEGPEALQRYFDSKDATGVVTWDHSSADGTRRYNFGDVYVKGDKVGNVFEDYGRDNGNLMMTQWLFTKDQKVDIFSNSNVKDALDTAVQTAREENTVNAEKAVGSLMFQSKVDEREEQFQEGWVDDALVGGSAAGGAATLGAAGLAVGAITGPGALITGGIGAVAGGILGLAGGLMNKDELTEQAARAYELTALANEEHGTGAAFTAGLQNWGGVAKELTSPFKNVSHGLVELTGDNEIGDGESAYYAVDKTGDETRSWWAKPLGMAGMVVDGAAQFISPFNRGVYTAQMGSTIAGESGTLLLTGGEAFDPRTGSYENIFTDDDGNFDPVSGAAGILKIGIDVVQLAGMRALANQSRSAREAIAAGNRPVDVGGYRYILDDAGRVVDRKVSFTMLAPSEIVSSASIARKARLAAMNRRTTGEGGAFVVTADDYYRAATAAVTGTGRVKQALVNGFGEGMEELAQGVLEPISMDGRIWDPKGLADSFLMGAASGTGMSLGGTYVNPNSSQRMEQQAFFLETMRRDGVEPTQEEWDALWTNADAGTRKQLATRTEADVQKAALALTRMAEEQSARFVASEADAARAADARKSRVAKELENAAPSTDAYRVITGLLEPGKVAEGVGASAATVAQMFESRLTGLASQRQTLVQRIADIESGRVTSTRPDDVLPTDLAEAQEMLRDIDLAIAFGTQFNEDLVQAVEAIDTASDEATARRVVDALNDELIAYFTANQQIDPVAAEGELANATQEELRRAAAMYVTHLHSREPKTDAGSYVPLLPQVDFGMTASGSHHYLAVNTDILEAIQGDFDGDKMHAEYQLILPRERFLQVRAGQNLGGRAARSDLPAGVESGGEFFKLDVATHHFDEAINVMLGAKLTGGTSQLEQEAEATLTRIEQILHRRYGALMPADVWEAAFTRFREEIKAGNPEARQILLSDLAMAAGGPITELGRRDLRNEWLWASQVIRRELQTFQRTHSAVRAAEAIANSEDGAARDITTPEGKNAAKSRAVNDAQTLSLFAVGNTLFRKFQKIHFTFFNSGVLTAAGAEKTDLFDMAELYAELSRFITQSELDRLGLGNTIEAKVLVMLSRLVDSALNDPVLGAQFDPRTAMSVFANIKVKDVWWEDGNPVTNDENISLVQLLLKRALEQERIEHRLTYEMDTALQAKHNRLRPLTFSNESTGQINAERAFYEVFKAIPYQESLGGVTGMFAPHTTPEQWMSLYLSLDADGRQDMERLYTNVPEHLDRAESTNIPYTLSEMQSRSISAYRSMLDAMLAVGRAELTFDPEKGDSPRDAFDGRMAGEAKATYDGLAEIHANIRDLVALMRQDQNRTQAEREDTAKLVQEAFVQYRDLGFDMLQMIDDDLAVAVFETVNGERTVRSWIYDAFAKESADEAILHLVWNMKLGRAQALQEKWKEDDGAVPANRYLDIDDRFIQLLYRLGQEPGGLRLEQLIRKRDEVKSLWELAYWINTQPGFLRNEPPLLLLKDDVADFDSSRSSVWSQERTGAKFREAVMKAKATAAQVSKVAAERAQHEVLNRDIRADIRFALEHPDQADSLQLERLRQFKQALKLSRELPRGFAPAAMLAVTAGAQDGVEAHSHTKGVSRDSTLGLGEFQALMDAFAFLPNAERIIEGLGSVSVDSLVQNLGDLASTSGRAMNSDGRVIEWAPMDVGEALDLLDDPRTEPLAYAILVPTALEDRGDGRLVERMLYEPNMQNLLSDKHYRDMLNLDVEGEVLSRALNYLMVLDARIRRAGGHFDMLRMVNSLVITRTSGLTHELLDPVEKEAARAKAVIDLARAAMIVGRVEVDPSLRDANVMEELLELGLEHLQTQLSTKGTAFTGSKEAVQSVLDMINAQLALEEQERADEIEQEFASDPAEQLRRTEIVRRQYAAAQEYMDGMLSSGSFEAAVARYEITGDPTIDAMSRANLLAFARSDASFPARAPESADLWRAIGLADRNGTDLPDTFDWARLSRSVTALHLFDNLLNMAGHVSVPPLLEGKNGVANKYMKYYDPEFQWIMRDLFGPDSKVREAAGWLHVVGSGDIGTMDATQLFNELKQGILNTKDLGTFTPGLWSQLVDHQAAIDSAGSGPGAGASGNGPKRWAALSAAVDSTDSVLPDVIPLTTLTLTGDFWGETSDPFQMIPVTPEGTTVPTEMPLALLDNRFFSSITVNGEEILHRGSVGFTWERSGDNRGLKYASLFRIRQEIMREAKLQGIDPATMVVEVSFIHPDSRPPGPEYSNNAYFDGKAHAVLPDGSESLVAAAWSDNGGLTGIFLQRMLDAAKKQQVAVQPFSPVNAAAEAAAEELWAVGHDLAAMLRAKTKIVLEYDDGTGPMEIADFNSMYKILASHHIVVGRDKETGRPRAMKAEEFIALRAANGPDVVSQDSFPMTDVRLVKLSPDVLRTMVGEFGDQGVDQYVDTEFLVNTDLIRPYTEITDEMLERFGEGWLAPVGGLADTKLINVGRQTTLPMRKVATPRQYVERATRTEMLASRTAEIGTQRYVTYKKKDRKQRMQEILEVALDIILPERNNVFDFASQGIPFAPADSAEVTQTLRLLTERDALLDRGENTQARAFELKHKTTPDYPGGILSYQSLLENQPLEHQTAVDDIVLIHLESFQSPEMTYEQSLDLVLDAVRRISETGATVILGAGAANTYLRYDVERELTEKFNYVGLAGSAHIFVPVEFSTQTQNERAYESTYMETYTIKPNRNSVIVLTDDPVGITEGNGVPNEKSPRMRSRRLLNNILPSSMYPHYNVPIEDNRDIGLYARTLAHLRTHLDPSKTDSREALLEMAGEDPRGELPIAEALDRFFARIKGRATVALLPGDELEVGDIIPFVHSDGKVILYRHGFLPPKPEELADLQSVNGMNIALAKSKRDDKITAHTATVRDAEPRAGYGRTLELVFQQQLYGSKFEHAWNGVKYTFVMASDFLKSFFDVKLFAGANNRLVDFISDRKSADDKEGYRGRVDNYRNALTFFQFDFTDDLVEFFFPGRKGEPGLDLAVHSLLERLSHEEGARIPLANAALLARFRPAVAEMLDAFAAANEDLVPSDWTERLYGPEDSVEQQIAFAVISYIAVAGGELNNVIRSAGFTHPNAENDTVETRVVPGLFADLLNNGPSSALHAELIKRFNAQLGKNVVLTPEWDVIITDGKKQIRGVLAFGEMHSANTNPALDAQAFNPNGNQKVSWHNALASALSLGGITAHKPLSKSRAQSTPLTDEDVEKMNSAAGRWESLQSLSGIDHNVRAPWHNDSPAGVMRRTLAREEISGLFHRLNTEGETWSAQNIAKYNNLAVKILTRLNLHREQIGMVDTWVRMYLGKPYGIDPETGLERGVIPADKVLEVLAKIMKNVERDVYPTTEGAIPLMPVNHVTVIYQANLNRMDRPWAPKLTNETDSAKAASWDSWVETAFGSAWIVSENQEGIGFEALFEPTFLLAVDGMMHGYQGATSDTRDLPVSSDLLREKMLIDPVTNRELASISGDVNIATNDPVLYSTITADLDDIVGGPRIYSPGREEQDSQSALGWYQRSRQRWMDENEMAKPRGRKTVRNVRQEGQSFVKHASRTSGFWRTLQNIRVGNVLFNLSLIAVAPFEALIRGSVNRMAAIATGEATGRVGRIQSRLAGRITNPLISEVARALGFEPRYTMEQHRKLEELIDVLSTRPEFRSMVYKELFFQYGIAPGAGRIERTTEAWAKFWAAAQDPSYGMPPKSLARLYVEAVLSAQAYGTPEESIYSIERMIVGMSTDPTWIKDNDREAHFQGIARISNVRSLKPTVISKAFRGVVEPLSERHGFFAPSAGQMLLLLTKFQNFWANSLINMTGMQGPHDFAAFWLDGRKKSKLIRRMQAAVAGEPFVPGEDEYYDMSEVIEGMDLADSFIKGGITHTALFQLGMFASGLGLSGDDDETKFRRRQSEIAGVPMIYDPRALQNDIRNRDAIFLDWLPFGMDSWFLVDPDDPDSRSMAQMNWTLRYFLSPIIGMERFFETGDFGNVVSGFQDALGAHPVINQQLWDQTMDTVAELHAISAEEVENGRPEEGGRLLITAVSTMERMLMENAMINAIYVGADTYDRDPYKIAMMDSDGNQQLDVRGNPYQSDIVAPFRNEDGEIQEGYVARDSSGSLIRSFTENRFGLAMAASLWDGLTGGSFNGDFWRQNMVVKTRDVQLLPTDRKEITAQLLAAYQGAGGQVNLTQAESEQRIKRIYEANGVYWDADEVEKLAAVDSAKSGMAAMSIIKDGREHLTDDGARAIFEGLRSGMLSLGEAGLNGVYMTKETRDKVRDTMVAELMQEGVDLGLSRDQAEWRMRRIMFGTGTTEGTPNLIELIYTDQIPWTDTLEYNQLNTTYVMGPNGQPMATGFTRDGFWGAMGVKLLKTQIAPTSGTGRDSANNTTDLVAGVNTGMRGLELRPDSWEIPTVEDVIRDAADEITDAIKDLDLTPNKYAPAGSGSGYSGGGGGGYYSGGSGGYFTRMYSMPRGVVAYGNTIPFINTTNPLIRRAIVRRERVWSERGRLKQWQ